jgi:hypothetical protein
VTLHVKIPEGNAEYVNLTAWSLPKICQPVGTVKWPDIKRKWKHLENVNLKAVGSEIDILLGLDHADLLVPLDVKMGKPQEPVAKRTSFGWMAVGLVGDIHSYHVARAEPEPLDVTLSSFGKASRLGLRRRTCHTTPMMINEPWIYWNTRLGSWRPVTRPACYGKKTNNSFRTIEKSRKRDWKSCNDDLSETQSMKKIIAKLSEIM